MERWNWIEDTDAPAEDVAAYRAIRAKTRRRCHIYAGRVVYRQGRKLCAVAKTQYQPAPDAIAARNDPDAEYAGAWLLVALAAGLAAVGLAAGVL